MISSEHPCNGSPTVTAACNTCRRITKLTIDFSMRILLSISGSMEINWTVSSSAALHTGVICKCDNNNPRCSQYVRTTNCPVLSNEMPDILECVRRASIRRTVSVLVHADAIVSDKTDLVNSKLFEIKYEGWKCNTSFTYRPEVKYVTIVYRLQWEWQVKTQRK